MPALEEHLGKTAREVPRVPPKPTRKGPPKRDPERKAPVKEPPTEEPPKPPVREPPEEARKASRFGVVPLAVCKSGVVRKQPSTPAYKRLEARARK